MRCTCKFNIHVTKCMTACKTNIIVNTCTNNLPHSLHSAPLKDAAFEETQKLWLI